MPLHINEQAMLIDTPVEFCKESPESYYIVTDNEVVHIYNTGWNYYSAHSNFSYLQHCYEIHRNKGLKCPRCPRTEVFDFVRKITKEELLKHFEKS